MGMLPLLRIVFTHTHTHKWTRQVYNYNTLGWLAFKMRKHSFLVYLLTLKIGQYHQNLHGIIKPNTEWEYHHAKFERSGLIKQVFEKSAKVKLVSKEEKLNKGFTIIQSLKDLHVKVTFLPQVAEWPTDRSNPIITILVQFFLWVKTNRTPHLYSSLPTRVKGPSPLSQYFQTAKCYFPPFPNHSTCTHTKTRNSIKKPNANKRKHSGLCTQACTKSTSIRNARLTVCNNMS